MFGGEFLAWGAIANDVYKKIDANAASFFGGHPGAVLEQFTGAIDIYYIHGAPVEVIARAHFLVDSVPGKSWVQDHLLGQPFDAEFDLGGGCLAERLLLATTDDRGLFRFILHCARFQLRRCVASDLAAAFSSLEALAQ